MEKNFKRTLVTTALPYANGPVHISVFLSIYTPGLLLRYTVKRHRTSSVNCMIKANSSKKPLYNIMTKKQNNSWQTAILQELVPIVRTKELTETNVKLAEPPLMRRILLTLNLQ